MKKLAIMLSCVGGWSLSSCDGGSAGTTGTQTSQESGQVADTSRGVYNDAGFMGADTSGQVLGTPTQTESQTREGGTGIRTEENDGTATGTGEATGPTLNPNPSSR